MEKYTRYEIARILGARALQISMNAPLLMDIPKEKLEELNYDPLKIAEMEFNANVLPITVKRPLPSREEETEEEKEELDIIEEEGEMPAEKTGAVEKADVAASVSESDTVETVEAFEI